MSKILKLKAIIYKYTGWYLADKEENEYLQSKECWKSILKFAKGKDKDFANPRNAQSLLIGMWQAKHGFSRPATFLKYRKPRALWAVIGWFADLYKVIQWDIHTCLRKMRS